MVPVYHVDLEQRLRLKRPKTRRGIVERESPPSEIAEDGVVETREFPSEVGPSIIDVGACGGSSLRNPIWVHSGTSRRGDYRGEAGMRL